MDKEIHLVVSTHQGKLYDEVCDYAVVKNKDGEFAVFPNHIPVITSFDEGFVKMVRAREIYYVALVSAIIEFHQNEFTVLAQEAHIGKDMEEAMKHLASIRLERLEKNREIDVDLTMKEKEIMDNLKKSKAGNL